jgi:hypothetical protein
VKKSFILRWLLLTASLFFVYEIASAQVRARVPPIAFRQLVSTCSNYVGRPYAEVLAWAKSQQALVPGEDTNLADGTILAHYYVLLEENIQHNNDHFATVVLFRKAGVGVLSTCAILVDPSELAALEAVMPLLFHTGETAPIGEKQIWQSNNDYSVYASIVFKENLGQWCLGISTAPK